MKKTKVLEAGCMLYNKSSFPWRLLETGEWQLLLDLGDNLEWVGMFSLEDRVPKSQLTSS